MSIEPVGGALRIVYAQEADKSALAAIWPRDLREQRVTLTVVTPPAASTTHQLRLTVVDRTNSQNRIRILLEAGTLYGRVVVNDVFDPTAGVLFDAVAHKHWRIRAGGFAEVDDLELGPALGIDCAP